MNIDEGFFPLTALESFGNVFHGAYDTVTGFMNRDGAPIDGLSSASTFQARRLGSCTHLISYRLPEVETPDDEVAKGWLRWNNAYLFGIDKSYSINGATHLFETAGWPYRSPDGTVWHLMAYNKGGTETGKLGVYGHRLEGITEMSPPDKIPVNLLFEVALPAGALPYATNTLYTLFSPDGTKAAIHNYRAANTIQWVVEVDVSGGSATDAPILSGSVTLNLDDWGGPTASERTKTTYGTQPAFSGPLGVDVPSSSLGYFALNGSPDDDYKQEWNTHGYVYGDIPPDPVQGDAVPAQVLTRALFVGYNRYGVRQLVEFEQVTNAEVITIDDIQAVGDGTCNIPWYPPISDFPGKPHNTNLPDTDPISFTYDFTAAYVNSQSFLRNGVVVAKIEARNATIYSGNTFSLQRPLQWSTGQNPNLYVRKSSFVVTSSNTSTTKTGNGYDTNGNYVGGSYLTFEYQTCGLNVWCMKKPSTNTVYGWVTSDWNAVYSGTAPMYSQIENDIPLIAADPLTGAFSPTTIRYF